MDAVDPFSITLAKADACQQKLIRQQLRAPPFVPAHSDHEFRRPTWRLARTGLAQGLHDSADVPNAAPMD